MNGHHSRLSLGELIEEINKGGWVVSGGYQARGFLGFPIEIPVLRASSEGEKLKIETHQRNFEVLVSKIVLFKPWIIKIEQAFMRRQPRKKKEGGGWLEIPAVGVAIRLSNPAIKEAIMKEREERKRKEKES